MRASLPLLLFFFFPSWIRMGIGSEGRAVFLAFLLVSGRNLCAVLRCLFFLAMACVVPFLPELPVLIFPFSLLDDVLDEALPSLRPSRREEGRRALFLFVWIGDRRMNQSGSTLLGLLSRVEDEELLFFSLTAMKRRSGIFPFFVVRMPPLSSPVLSSIFFLLWNREIGFLFLASSAYHQHLSKRTTSLFLP